jgi:hypothetical protein
MAAARELARTAPLQFRDALVRLRQLSLQLGNAGL